MRSKQGKTSSTTKRRKRPSKRVQQALDDLSRRVQQAEEMDRSYPFPFENEPKTRSFLLFDLMSDNTSGFVMTTAMQESIAARLRHKLLADLPNLSEACIAQCQTYLHSVTGREEMDMEIPSLKQGEIDFLRRLFQFWKVSDRDLLKLRDEIRTIWTTAAVSGREAEEIMQRWLEWKPAEHEHPKFSFSPSLELGRIVLDPRNLHAQMVQAVLERSKYMKICGNPDCANPYFIARRNDQKFCETGICTNYGHRVAAREHYRKTQAVDESAYRIKSESGEERPVEVFEPKKGQGHGRKRTTTKKRR